MLRALLQLLLFTCITSGATAATLSGVSLPDSYVVDGRPLALNGIGVRTLTIFRIRTYVAALYLPQPSHDARQILASSSPKVILLRFVHSGSKAQVERQYRAGEEANCGTGGCAASDQADFERLVAAAPAVKPGDTSTYIFSAAGVSVFANNRLLGEFANQDLAYHLLAGFIGDHPPSQDLRRALLGLPAD